MESNKLLILFAHPNQARSEVNRPLYAASQQFDQVTCVDLYREYPTFRIDVDKEQRRLLEHDTIVFMFPLYWYSTPAILKEWQDLVLEYGFAYGRDGKALHGKRFFCAITAGGAEKAYRADGYNHFTLEQLLQPLQQTAQLCGMEYWPPYAIYSSRTAQEEGRIQRHVDHWQLLLKRILRGDVDQGSLNGITHLNELITQSQEITS
ncbi:NAD(P)H-dependent oxidoreductase [Paraferrimonas sedimenticola]|uniref:Potassium transporter KefG n=1 Tax=Paraferrimonas sedimenticola TaxID=375674 RepID=A0AA37W0J9_9GAMM|nr:NAD(P)H-dependent oxidoreductase [Paraferrimonas sedimenticola]GLP95473.1 potassium transporter KefG [Paraferrimonas sedimenticola]